jgi:uncharacterized protein YjbI with pentapeptide repeats
MIWLQRLFRRIGEEVLPVIDSPSVRRVAGLLLLGAVFACLLLSIQRVPEWQTKRASVRSSDVNPEAKTTPEDVAALQNEMRKTLLQEVGGAFALFALYLTFRRVKVAEQGHITDRYTKAIEQLGALTADNKPNVEVRLGAIYALERIAFDSPRDHWPIMEVLTAYVRQNAPAPAQNITKQVQENDAQDTTEENEEPEIANAKKPATEIQAILTVLGRRKRDRKREGKGQQLNLSNSDLCGANFIEAHLDGAIFDEAYLVGTIFDKAHLDGAWFGVAHLAGASFLRAHLDGAYFYKANLTGARFSRAHLAGAFFTKAHLARADFKEAYLKGANFYNAHLEGADFTGAHLDGARFSRAYMDNVCFDRAYLNGAWFNDAFLDATVRQFADSLGVDQAYFNKAFRRELEAAKIVPTKPAVGNDDTPQDTHHEEE